MINVDSKHDLRFDKLDISYFILIEKIESGGFSIVYLSKLNKGKLLSLYPNVDKLWLKRYFAVKIISKLKYFNKIHLDIHREYSVLSKLDHTNIIKVYAEYEGDKDVYLILEYVDGNDLFNILTCYSSRFKFEQEKAINYLRNILNGLNYLYKSGVIHGDIKLENLLLTKDKIIKLIDFGHSVDTKKKVFRTGTPSYMSPEVIQKIEAYPIKSEIWCIGVLLYEMLTGKVPFKGSVKGNLFPNIIDINYTFAFMNVSKESQNLIESILKYNPEDRPTIEQILDHKLFNI